MVLRNLYDKSRRSSEKPCASGPAAYVFPAGEKRSGSQVRLLRILQLQHVEVSRLASATTVNEPERTNEAGKKTADIAGRRRFPAGRGVVRMDQPYSRIADTLPDRQSWAPQAKNAHPYSDTGRSKGDTFAMEVARGTAAHNP